MMHPNPALQNYSTTELLRALALRFPVRLRGQLEQQLLGVSLVLIYIFGIAFKGTFAKLAYQHGGSVMAVLMWRFLLSIPVFWSVMLVKLGARESFNITRKQLLACAFTGCFGFYAFVYCDYQGLMFISVSLERIVLFTYPVFVILLNILLTRRLPRFSQVGALLVVQAGIGILLLPFLSAGNESMVGMLWVLASAVFHAIYILCLQKFTPSIGPVKFTTYTMTICFAAILIHFMLTTPLSDMALNPESMQYVIEMVLFSTVLPTFCLAAGVKIIGGNRASIISTLGPVITLVAAYYIFGDKLNANQMLAGVIIFGGILFLEFSAKQKMVKRAIS